MPGIPDASCITRAMRRMGHAQRRKILRLYLHGGWIYHGHATEEHTHISALFGPHAAHVPSGFFITS